eukprot:GHVN01091572.1.p1 GENE.GHVN01091572.1~~GHVN01091572.1.p1  ORF type:complete len:109 (-),score=33.50 GHVN01091572.1:566-892(-)
MRCYSHQPPDVTRHICFISLVTCGSFVNPTAEHPITPVPLYPSLTRTTNLPHLTQIICDPSLTHHVVKLCERFHIEAKVVGRVEGTHRADQKNEVLIKAEGEALLYSE